MKTKIVKLSNAYVALDEAKEILRQLEKLADDSVKPEKNNVAEVVTCVHQLREKTDHILIDLVESQMFSDQIEG